MKPTCDKETSDGANNPATVSVDQIAPPPPVVFRAAMRAAPTNKPLMRGYSEPQGTFVKNQAEDGRVGLPEILSGEATRNIPQLVKGAVSESGWAAGHYPKVLQAQREDARKRIDALQKEVNTKTDQINGKEMELQRALGDVREIQARYDDLTENQQELISELRELKSRVETAEAERDRLRAELGKDSEPEEQEEAAVLEEDGPPPPLPNLKREKSSAEKAMDTTINVMQGQINKLIHENKNTESAKEIVETARRTQGEKLKDLEHEKIKMFDEITRLKEELAHEQHKNIEKLRDMKDAGIRETNRGRTFPPKIVEYPPDETVIQNLLRSQIEFYFSNYNLKRDKPLLEKMVANDKHKGFLSIEEIEKLPKVRQLAPDRPTIMEALKRSEYLVIQETPSTVRVGRPNFTEPERQEFPFRRTVFVYGLPAGADEAYVRKMCSSFGQIKKIKFDAGPDTLDRHIGRRLLNKPRVKKIYSTCSLHYELEFTSKHPQQYQIFKCSWCVRQFHTAQGFYHDENYRTLVCLQCAAKRAESQLGEFNDHRSRGIPTLSSELLGDDAKRYGLTDYRTSLVVFESQRQASKCVYVRSRLGFEGCFATHFHHYSKLKKEQVSTYEPAFRLVEKVEPRFGSPGGLTRPNLKSWKSYAAPPSRRNNKMRPPGFGNNKMKNKGAGGHMMERFLGNEGYEQLEHQRRHNRNTPPGLAQQRDAPARPKQLGMQRYKSEPIRRRLDPEANAWQKSPRKGDTAQQ